MQCLVISSTIEDNRVLYVDGGSFDESKIVTWDSLGYDDQKWHLERNSDSSFAIRNNRTDKCIEGTDTLYQKACQGQGNQKWYLQKV